MLGIVDYGVGNLFSLWSSFKSLGIETKLIADPDELKTAERIILPGVGAFGDAAKKLRETGMFDAVKHEAAAGKPIMGICLGMQLLLQKSYEFGEHEGLGLIDGEVRPIADVIPADYKIPHIGWNELDFSAHPLFKYLNGGECVYFVHSYYGASCPNVIATTDYGAPLTAAVADGNVTGCQFHPEKSGPVGLSILRAFCEM